MLLKVTLIPNLFTVLPLGITVTAGESFGVVCHRKFRLRPWIREYDKGRIRILVVDIPFFTRLLSTVLSERDCGLGHFFLFVYFQFNVVFVAMLTERMHLISVYNSHTSAKSTL